MLQTKDLTERLEAYYPMLSPKLKLAARYVLDAPDDVALSSMRDVAAKAGVHPSTMVRLAKQLDFPGYAKFREPFRARLRARPASLTARAHQLKTRRAPRAREGLFQELLEAGGENVTQTFTATSAEELQAAADALAAARRIYVAGMRKCFPVAWYLHYSFRMFRQEVALLTGVAGTLADELRDLDRRDAMIAIGYDPYTNETVQAVRHAADVGAEIVSISDSPVSPIAAPARFGFVAANSGPSFFRSLAGAQALAEALVAFLLARGRRAQLDVLAQSEEQLVRFGTYWPESSTGGGS